VLHFIQEIQYSNELEQIEPDSEKADEISLNVEAAVRSTALTVGRYGVLCLQYRHRNLIVWYLMNGSSVSLISIRTS
jgi:hypothetical protein